MEISFSKFDSHRYSGEREGNITPIFDIAGFA